MNIIVINVPNPDVKYFSLDNFLVTDSNILKKLESITDLVSANLAEKGIRIEKKSLATWNNLEALICNLVYQTDRYEICYKTISENEIQTEAEQLYLKTKGGLEVIKEWLTKAIER